MSIRMGDYGDTLEIFAGTTKQFTITITDPTTGSAIDMSDTVVYASGIFKILKPDFTQIGTNVSISFSSRAAGQIQFTITSTIAAVSNAGNWIGELEISNATPVVIDQQRFNFNIIQSNS